MNEPLKTALDEWRGDPAPERRAAVLGQLGAGTLVLALHDLPLEATSADTPGERCVRFATLQDEGETWLCAFAETAPTTQAVLGGLWIALDAGRVLRWALDAGFAGLVLLPRAGDLRVRRDELCDLLGMPERKSPQGRSLSLGEEPENAVREALDALLECSYADAGARIREPRTGKAVLFALTADGALLMDVPRGDLSLDEAERARILLQDLSGHTFDEGETEAASFQALFGDTGRAAKAAVKVFTWVFGFPPGFALEIEEP